jgi:sugar/nucleoside kinase (ribokinase family)
LTENIPPDSLAETGPWPETRPAGESPSVFGLGTIVVDHQVVLASLPEADTKGEVIADRHQVGGPVPTALSLLRNFGLRTAFQGRWSDDSFGRMIEADLQSQSIEFDPCQCRTATRSGFAHVWVEQETGRRTIAAYRGSHAIEPLDLMFERLAGFDALHLDGWSTTAAMEAAKVMKQCGGQVFLDLGSPKPHLEHLLQHVDVLNCPERLIHRLFACDELEQGAHRLLALGPREITVTRGEFGAIHFTKSKVTRHPEFKVNAVDTNGAGDVFCGAIIYGTVRNWGAEKKMAFACAAAALKCRQLGNRDALPTLGEIEALLTSKKRPVREDIME